MQHRWWKTGALFVVWGVWLVLSVEWLSRSSLGDALAWVGRSLPAFGVSDLLASGLLLFLWGLTGRARVAYWLAAGLLLAPAFLSGAVLRTLGRPGVFHDFLLLKEAGGVARWQDLLTLPAVTGLLVFGGGSYLLVHRGPTPGPATGRQRTLLAAGAAVAVLGVSAGWSVGLAPARAGWDPVEAIRTQGFVLTELRDWQVRSSVGAVPAGAALPAPADPSAGTPAPAPAPPVVKPNIILVLSESFWDPTQLPGTRFDPDPLPFFRELQRTYPSGTLLTPEFGGTTANVELEVLTGLSRQFFPTGSIAYMQHIRRPVDSLASILTRQGYRTTAITPWQHWFFKSDQIYRYFGFGKFISVEFYGAKVEGDYMADSETAKMIIEESGREPGPSFIFANTSENHSAYYVGKFPRNTVDVTGLPSLAAGIVETYAEGTRRADAMLKTLVEYYAGRPEPTMLVWFGDHLPTLGQEFLAYRQSGYISGENDPQFLEKLYRVPLLVWTNYKEPKADRLSFGTNQLGPYILREAGLAGTPFTEYLTDLGKRVPAVPPRRFWASMGLPEAELARYEAIQQEIITGEQTIYGPVKEQIVNPGYVIGHGPLALDRIEPEPGGGAGSLWPVTIRGRNLPRTGVLYVGGRPVATTWESFEVMRAKVPQGTFEAELRVLNEDKEIVVRSNALKITVPVP